MTSLPETRSQRIHLRTQQIRTPTSSNAQFAGGVTVVESDAQHRELLCRLEDTGLIVAFDLESVGVNPKTESPVGRGTAVCWSIAYADPALGLHPKHKTPLARRYFLWSDSLEYFRDWLSSGSHHKVGDGLWSFDKHILCNQGFVLSGIFCDNLRLSKLLAAHSQEHDLKTFMQERLGYKINQYSELFRRRVCLEEEDHGEPRYRKRTVAGIKLDTLVGGPASRIGAGWQTLDLRRFANDYPERVHQVYEYASLDAKGSLERFYYQQRAARAVEWRGLGQTRKYGTLWDFYEQIWHPFLSVLWDLERAGIVYDPSRTEHGLASARETVRELLESVQSWTGNPEFNPASGPQLVEWLYETCAYKVPPVKGSRTALKKTKPNEKPTTEASLAWLKANGYGSPGLDSLVSFRKEVRQLQFLEKLPQHVLPSTGRIHSVLQPEAATGRLTSKLPNLQQIPKRYDPYKIRGAFVPGPGNVFVVSDYSGLELVVLAHFLIDLFDDHSLANDLATGDAHEETARKLGVSRDTGKSINFGISYGKGALGLGLSLGIPTMEAQKLLDDHAKAYPGVKRFQEYCFEEAKRTGVVRTLAGRIRPLPEAKSQVEWMRHAAFRQAANTPIQGSAADIVISAMLKLHRELSAKARVVLQIHDELIVECQDKIADDVLSVVIGCMENPFKTPIMRVPLKTKAIIARSWGCD